MREMLTKRQFGIPVSVRDLVSFDDSYCRNQTDSLHAGTLMGAPRLPSFCDLKEVLSLYMKRCGQTALAACSFTAGCSLHMCEICAKSDGGGNRGSSALT